jgi:Na+-translocating ferredoxin:NAD+ oxidoreductase RnfD subunit
LTLARFFRTPKGLLILILSGLIVLAAFGESTVRVVESVVAASVASMAVDAVILRVRRRRWHFPDGALLTAMLVAMVLSPRQPVYVTTVTAVLGVVTKYLVRVRKANVFNPAALGLVATFYVFHTAQSWWGALAEIAPVGLLVLVAAGVYETQRVNRVPSMLAFLGSYYALFTTTAFAGDPAKVAEVYRAPDLHAALFFAFFMVTDPPTSPPRPRDQVVYGAIAGVVSYAAFEILGAAYFLLAGVLVANTYAAWRRRSR